MTVRLETMRKPEVKKISSGYTIEYDTHVMEYDPRGVYRGQWQDNVLSEEPDRIFIKSGMGGPKVEPLTKEQMDNAK